jgi:uncharacterized protein involved in outer membrane biogenesis
MLRRVLIGLAIVLVAAIAVALLIDWEEIARGFVERQLEARTGRDVRLERVEIHARLPLRIELVGLSIANPEWAQRQPLLSLQSADFTVRLLPLLTRREIVLPRVVLVRPEANLEQRNGERSWAFRAQEDTREEQAANLPQVHALSLTDATVRYIDPETRTDLTVRASQSQDEDHGRAFAFEADGRYKAEELEVQGRGASLLSLADQGAPYPLQLQASVGKTTASFLGEVVNLARLERVAGDVVLEGDNLEHLYRIAGMTLPATPPYRLAGRLVREGAVWRLEGFDGAMGDSDMSGDVTVDTGQKPPMLRAKLRSKLLDLDDLGPLVGAPPKTGPGETASPQQKKQAQQLEQKREVLPGKGFNTERWGRLNAQVSLDAQRIRRQKSLPIDHLSARMTMQDSVIELKPLRFGVADGNVDSTLRLDGRKAPLAVRMTTQFKGLQLNRLVPRLEAGKNSTGALFGDAQLATQGDSVQAMVASLDGRLYLAMGPGRISNLLLEAIGLDAGEIVRLFATGDRIIDLRCAVANFGVHQGVAKSEALVIATADTNVMGTGEVDLDEERLDLTMYVAPKDMSPVSFRAPLHVRGTFKDPQVRPDVGVLAAKGGAALLLGLVNPVLALVPLIETGPGTDSSCGELMQQAKGWREPKDPAARAVRRAQEKKEDEAGRAEPAQRAAVPETPRAADLLRQEARGGSGDTAARPDKSEAGGQKPGAGEAQRSRDRDSETPPSSEDAPRAEDLLERD